MKTGVGEAEPEWNENRTKEWELGQEIPLPHECPFCFKDTYSS